MGCPWIAHCWVSGLLKTVLGLCEMGHKNSMCFGMKLYEMNDLGWCGVEINRLILNEY